MQQFEHQNWIDFSDAQLRHLIALLDRHECTELLGVIQNFTAPHAKDSRFRDAAKELPRHRRGECEIDDHAVTSVSDDGAYVLAWVWVSNEDAGVEA